MWNGTDTEIEIYWLRHGKTVSNLEARYIGRTDETLCSEGRGELAPRETVDLLFSSPMKRCVETARICYPDREPIIIETFREMDFGRFEGKNYRELEGDSAYRDWIESNGTLPFPEGESREAFCDRCLLGFCEMMDCIRETLLLEPHARIRVAAVVHGGTIMAVLSALCGGDYFDYRVANAKGYHLILKLTENGEPIVEELRREE